MNDTTRPRSPAKLAGGAVVAAEGKGSLWAMRHLLPTATRQDQRFSPRGARTDLAAAPAPAFEQIVEWFAEVGLGVENFLRDWGQEDAAARDCADVASGRIGGARGTLAFFARAARQTTLHNPASQAWALEAPLNAVDEPDGR